MMIIIDELKICLAKNAFCLIKKEEKFSTIPSKRQIILNSHQIIQYSFKLVQTLPLLFQQQRSRKLPLEIDSREANWSKKSVIDQHVRRVKVKRKEERERG